MTKDEWLGHRRSEEGMTEIKTMDREAIKSSIADLVVRIEALNTEAEPVRKQLGNIDRQRGRLIAEKQELETRLKVASEDPRVSDHAVIRWLERKHGFNFEHVAPAAGDPVNYGFNGDYYPDGEIVRVTKTTVITSTGSRYRRRGSTASWIREGGTWSLVPGHISRLNNEF